MSEYHTCLSQIKHFKFANLQSIIKYNFLIKFKLKHNADKAESSKSSFFA